MPRFVYVIARERRDLYEILRAEFAGQADVAVVVDRRRGERRQASRDPGVELRRAERRQQRDLDAELRSVGAFITACQGLVLIEIL